MKEKRVPGASEASQFTQGLFSSKFKGPMVLSVSNFRRITKITKLLDKLALSLKSNFQYVHQPLCLKPAEELPALGCALESQPKVLNISQQPFKDPEGSDQSCVESEVALTPDPVLQFDAGEDDDMDADAASRLGNASLELLLDKIISALEIEIPTGLFAQTQEFQSLLRDNVQLKRKLEAAILQNDKQFEEFEALQHEHEHLQRLFKDSEKTSAHLQENLAEMAERKAAEHELRQDIARLREQLDFAQRYGVPLERENLGKALHELQETLAVTQAEVDALRSSSVRLTQTLGHLNRQNRTLKSAIRKRRQRLQKKFAPVLRRQVRTQQLSSSMGRYHTRRQSEFSRTFSSIVTSSERTASMSLLEEIGTASKSAQTSDPVTLLHLNLKLTAEVALRETRLENLEGRVRVMEEQIAKQDPHKRTPYQIVKTENMQSEIDGLLANIKTLQAIFYPTMTTEERMAEALTQLDAKMQLIAFLRHSIQEKSLELARKDMTLTDVMSRLRKHTVVTHQSIQTPGSAWAYLCLKLEDGETSMQPDIPPVDIDPISPVVDPVASPSPVDLPEAVRIEMLKTQHVSEKRALERDYRRRLDDQRESYLTRIQQLQQQLLDHQREKAANRQSAASSSILSSVLSSNAGQKHRPSIKLTDQIALASSANVPELPTKIAFCIKEAAVTIQLSAGSLKDYSSVLLHVVYPRQFIELDTHTMTYEVNTEGSPRVRPQVL